VSTTPPSPRPESLEIPFDGRGVETLGALYGRAPEGAPEGDSCAVLLAHGAGAPLDSIFMEEIAEGLRVAGHSVLRFAYPYMERARREGRRLPPDRMPALEAAHRAAIEFLRELEPGAPLVLAGKSMGGRVASHLAAQGVACDGLVYLGYPLHPYGKPEKLRDEHFPEVHTPSIFLQGSRDALCDLGLLRESLARYAGPWRLVEVEGADHAFDLPKRAGVAPEEVRGRLVGEVVAWLAELRRSEVQR